VHHAPRCLGERPQVLGCVEALQLHPPLACRG
jgi:hypothetical protein